MFFNSKEFIFVFLPITLAVFYGLSTFRLVGPAKLWLVFASLFIYFCWDPVFWPLLGISLGGNYFVSGKMTKAIGATRKKWLWAGIGFNVALLGYFKYTNFFLDTFTTLFGLPATSLTIYLPLGISFYTFLQLAYLIDIYEGLVDRAKFLDYALVVIFFPKMISGPIVHQKEMLTQLQKEDNFRFNSSSFAAGLFLFFIGLAKKVVMADNLALAANAGFSATENLNFIQSWFTSLAFTLQVYFDFSGYTDMAMGVALMFNIILPNNFNSPFRSTNIINFWQRWHMTLTRFLTTYIFSAILRSFKQITFPRFVIATLLTMLISGLWHGAAWLFVFFGLLHGIAISINHYWRKKKWPMPPWLGWLLTFNLVNFSNVFFRADDWNAAIRVLQGMIGMTNFVWPTWLGDTLLFRGSTLTFGNVFPGGQISSAMFVGLAIVLCFFFKNSVQMLELVQRPVVVGALYIVVIFYSIILLGQLDNHVYVYFQF